MSKKLENERLCFMCFMTGMRDSMLYDRMELACQRLHVTTISTEFLNNQIEHAQNLVSKPELSNSTIRVSTAGI